MYAGTPIEERKKEKAVLITTCRTPTTFSLLRLPRHHQTSSHVPGTFNAPSSHPSYSSLGPRLLLLEPVDLRAGSKPVPSSDSLTSRSCEYQLFVELRSSRCCAGEGALGGTWRYRGFGVAWSVRELYRGGVGARVLGAGGDGDLARRLALAVSSDEARMLDVMM